MMDYLFEVLAIQQRDGLLKSFQRDLVEPLVLKDTIPWFAQKYCTLDL